jgi:hypothetical protein
LFFSSGPIYAFLQLWILKWINSGKKDYVKDISCQAAVFHTEVFIDLVSVPVDLEHEEKARKVESMQHLFCHIAEQECPPRAAGAYY